MVSLPAQDRKRIAAALGLHEQYLYQCLSGRRALLPAHCAEVERATRAAVACERLRPDLAWVRIADDSWPHPKGRPCIDVASAAPGAPSEAAA